MSLPLERLPSLAELPPDGLLTAEETAAYLRISPETLATWRTRPDHHNGLPYRRLTPGRRGSVRYVVAEVREWLNGQYQNPGPLNSEETASAA